MDFDDQADLLRALLFQPALRRRLIEEGPFDALLEPVDRVQLARTTHRMAVAVRTRQSRGIGALTDVFARSLAGFTESEVHDLFEKFIASPEYAEVNEVPDRADAPCVEEAFGRFLGDTDLHRCDLLAAVLKLLVLIPEPAFRLPPEVRRTARGHVAVGRLHGAPCLFAAVDGRFLSGEVTEAVAALLERGVPAEGPVAARLRALGLL